MSLQHQVLFILIDFDNLLVLVVVQAITDIENILSSWNSLDIANPLRVIALMRKFNIYLFGQTRVELTLIVISLDKGHNDFLNVREITTIELVIK